MIIHIVLWITNVNSIPFRFVNTNIYFDYDADIIATTLAAIMGRFLSDIPIDPSEGIINHEEGIDLLPANIELSAIDLSLVNAMSRETVLFNIIGFRIIGDGRRKENRV